MQLIRKEAGTNLPFIYLPPIEKVPEGATMEQRTKMFEDYKKNMQAFNPAHFNEDGTMKSFWQWFCNTKSKKLIENNKKLK